VEQLRLAHNIGNENHSNYHTREEILACNDPIGFDGVYRNVYENQDVLKGKSGIMFVMGNFLGGNNEFDLSNVPKLERYCTLHEVKELCSLYAFEIGWHTWSHRNLCELSEKEILQEITSPFRTRYLRYPYGEYCDKVVECVKQVGYEKAYSVTQGVDDHPYKISSNYVERI
jgi:peptidoglycan/xylan/chitin deacetylase (PgdA/CDA1 family)